MLSAHVHVHVDVHVFVPVCVCSVVRRTSRGGWVSFNITYVAQLGTSKPLLAPWMLDRAATGGASVLDGAPFDQALVALSLHNLKHFGNHRPFANKLRESTLAIPSLWCFPSTHPLHLQDSSA